MAAPERELLNEDAGRLLGPFLESYIESKKGKPSTITNYSNAKDWLLKRFGRNKLLTEITPADCDRFHQFLLENLAVSTAEKILKRCKTMMTFAVRDRLIESSPFDGLKLSGHVNRDRDHFVSRPVIDAIIDYTPDHDWKLIFGLARYGGMRRCELTSLTWTDVLWEQGKLRIDSEKTGLRFCPLFPELESLLLGAQESAADGSVFVIRRYRRTSNLGTQANRIIEAAGYESWPKTFVNLRASRRTELQEQFPDHVINAWMGHSGKVAEKHYLQVTDDHWSRATDGGGNTGGNIIENQSESAASDAADTNEKTPAEGGRVSKIFVLAPPAGLEPAFALLARRCVGVGFVL
ncbi:phage integrase SAM-like domain-containing protein [Stieleria sp. ICT_E10.1]|uniref:tyrosine-type recombinase/integrase n=1 Tax=Stieleria sedimenti TaxID=2976331 RepID=UPI00217F70FD|nr:site-specific integrase [Stieleria sedimenti]MCS7466406.1 phage integrase SAM-like domain-containing protein [Stieleria sedimenti]